MRGMLGITFRDLRFRIRQFSIAIVGAGLVLAMTLVLAGLAASFSTEITQTVQGMNAQMWVVSSGSSGRITSLATLPARDAVAVAMDGNVKQAEPAVITAQAAVIKGNSISINVFGSPIGGLGSQHVVAGHGIQKSGEAVVDDRLGLAIGTHFDVSGVALVVVGTVRNRTLTGGDPNVYVSLRDAQAAEFGGRPLANAILTRGVPTSLPPGLAAFTNGEIEKRTLSQMASATSSLGSSRYLMWFIATVIMAALIYIAALQRKRDLAVLKAMGASTRMLFLSLAMEAVLVALIAAAFAAVIANFMTGLFDQPAAIPSSAFVVLPVSALVVGLLASLVALRPAVSADPATAFSAP